MPLNADSARCLKQVRLNITALQVGPILGVHFSLIFRNTGGNPGTADVVRELLPAAQLRVRSMRTFR